MKKINLAGQKFGRLEVLEQNGTLSNGKNGNLKAWLCICDCGEKITVRGRDLTTKTTQSCGCYRKEKSRSKAIIHGQYGTPLYKVWADIKKRCSGKGGQHKKRFYYDTGITVCNEWLDFQGFFKWAKTKWHKGLVVDRIDTTKGYYPENCRFVTTKINNQNSKRSKRWFINGKVFESSCDAAKFYGCAQSHIYFMCHGRNYNDKYYPPAPNCYAVKKYDSTK